MRKLLESVTILGKWIKNIKRKTVFANVRPFKTNVTKYVKM